MSRLTFLRLIVSFQDMGIEVDDSSESIQEFQMILDELIGDKSMDKIRGEYEKLIQVLIKSRENEKRLMSKCRELNAKIVSTTTKVADALKMRQEDETKMNFLKRVRLCTGLLNKVLFVVMIYLDFERFLLSHHFK